MSTPRVMIDLELMFDCRCALLTPLAESNLQCLPRSSRCFYPARFYLEPKVYLPIAGFILRPAVDAVEVKMYIAV